VILVSRSPAHDLARSAEMIYRGVLLKRLTDNEHIRILDSTHLVRITEAGVVLQDALSRHTELAVSRVLIAQGRKPDFRLADQLEAAGIAYIVIGDARRGGRIGDAVRDAYEGIVARTVPASATAGLLQLRC